MTNNTQQPIATPTSPSLPSLPASEPSSLATSPALSQSSSKFKPQPINIIHSKSLEPPQSSPRRGSIAAHLMHFAAKSTSSLHLLSSSAPARSGPGSASSQEVEVRSQVLPLRSTFSNPFKKLQNTFQGNSSSSKKSPDLGALKATERIASSSSSVNSMVSWRSKGAEIFSKKTWGRSRKNSEPTFGAKGIAQSPIFGASPEDAVRMSHIPGTPMVPAVLYRCAEYLEAKGIDEVGLYRVPGSHASVQKLKKMFDTGKDINLLAMDAIDPNDIATLLKLYLRELPSSLLPAVFLEQFQSVISTDRQVCHSLRGILVRLPRPNYVMLSFLCHHLSRIAAHSEKTKMNVSNLGVVFAPTLSIGSVLFKALLGGYYDTADTFENRENGLKLVWGGLLQECDFGVQEWPEDSANHAYQPVDQSALQSPLTPAQEIVQATLAVPAIPSEPAVSESIPRDLPCTPVVTLATPEESIFIAPGTIEDEEAKLMAAMLLREEMSTKQQDYDETVSDVSSSSDSIPCTDTTALSAVSSPGLNVKEHVFEAAFTSPSMTFSPTLASTAAIPSSATDECDNLSSPPPSSESSAIPELDQKPLCSSTPLSSAEETTAPVASTTATTAVDATYPTPPTINIIIDSGSLLLPESTPTSAKVQPELKVTMDKAEYKEDESEEDEEETAVVGPEFSPKIASEAPQLPPLEGLMIAL